MEFLETRARIPHSAPELLLPHPKRHKTSPIFTQPPMFTTNTPPPEADVNMLVDVTNLISQGAAVPQSLTPVDTFRPCPCQHLHGPGQGAVHDCHAVGLTNHPLFKGPWKSRYSHFWTDLCSHARSVSRWGSEKYCTVEFYRRKNRSNKGLIRHETSSIACVQVWVGSLHEVVAENCRQNLALEPKKKCHSLALPYMQRAQKQFSLT